MTFPTPTVTPLTESTNPLLVQGFEWYIPKDGKHWHRLSSVLGQLHQIGVTNLWIPPPTKAATEGSIGYDVYDLWDLGEFETHGRTATAMGSKDDLAQLAEEAHKWNIGILADAALNQRSGADHVDSCAITRLNPENREQAINPTRVSPVWVGFNFSSRGNRYSNKLWSCDDFSAIDYDQGTDAKGVFKVDGVNNDFATDVSTENGNFDYLLLADVAYANPSVRADVKLWGSWVTGQLGLSGFRIDAAKHISRAFIREWVTSIPTSSAMTFVAEYWTTNTEGLIAYLEGIDHVARVFDVPLLDKFAALGRGDETSLATMLNDTILSQQADSAVTIVANHDTQAGQDADTMLVEEWFRPQAYAFTLLRQEGYPCIFYGDLFGMYNESGEFAPAQNAAVIGKLAAARAYFAYGEQEDYASDESSVMGWTRSGDDKHADGLAVTISSVEDISSASVSMAVGKQHAGETWIDVLGAVKDSVKINDDGEGDFPVPPKSASAFVNKDAWDKVPITDWSFKIYD